MKKKIVVAGKKVHGIGYRSFLLAAAQSLEIERFFADNFITNGKQGVYILIDASKEKLNAFYKHISEHRPEGANVESIEQQDYVGNVMEVKSYYRYLTANQLSKIASIGGNMLEKQDSMLDKQDTMLGKMDSMLDKQDTMLGKMDSMLSKQDSTISVIREESKLTREELKETIKDEGEKTREVFKEHLAKDIARLYEEIAEIKATLSRVVEKVGA